MLTKEQFISEGHTGRDSIYDSYRNAYKTAKEANHQYWVGEIPVVENLRKFYMELKFKRPEFMPIIWGVAEYKNHNHDRMAYTKLCIAHKDSPDIAIGFIYIEQDKEWKYTVFGVHSKRIKNAKFSESSEGFCKAHTQKFTNAMKNARQYLKEQTVEELAKEWNGRAENALSEIRESGRYIYRQVGNIDLEAVFKEIKHMVSMGYTPVTAEFTKSLTLYKDKEQEIQELTNYKPRRCFVWLKPTTVEYMFADDKQQVIAKTVEEVPEEIRNKVAVLQISEENTAIKDVGQRVSPTTYWVFV